MFIRKYKRFLHCFVDLKDCAFLTDAGRRNRFRNEELEDFRNHPDLPYVERDSNARRPHRVYRGSFTPNLDQLEAHRLLQGNRTIFVSNKANSPTLIMLVDIDDKRANGDPEGAAAYLSRTYLGDRTYTEPSTGGRGRHVYFLLALGSLSRADAVAALKRFAQVIKSDPAFSKTYGVTFDSVFYGLPTLWGRDTEGTYHIAQRGNEMRLPYVANGEPDLAQLQILASNPLHINDLFRFLGRNVLPISSRPEEGGGKSAANGVEALEQGQRRAYSNGGDVRRARCVRANLLKNPNVTAEECLADYKANCKITQENNTDAQRLADFQRMLRKFKVTPSRRISGAKYLHLVRQIVPVEEFNWKRREKLDHARLADFVAVKLQDAFFEKPNRYFAMASRDATLHNFRELKKKGILDWICTSNQYTKLLDIACRFRLLHVYEEFVRPTRRSNGEKVFKGTARVIGPGKALVEERARFVQQYARWKAQRANTKAA
jgi:hypothetical protein